MSVIECVELDSGADANAVCTTFDEIATLILLVGPEPVGNLRWSIDSGEVTMIEVYPPHRRKGYATMLWRGAQWLCQERGWESVEHNPYEEQSDDARAWVASLKPPM